MINIKNIEKSFGSIRALSGISAAVGDGSIFGLIGSNGCGKSTLLRIMSGVYLPDCGEVIYDGAPVYENYALKQSIVYLSDEQYFPPHACLDDMRRLYKSVYDSFDDDRYLKMTDLFRLDRNRKISTFSKGMQKQSSLLLALSVRLRYLLCDETFDGLDPVMRQLVHRIIAEDVAESGITAVISSHNLRELEDFCDHICLMHRGTILIDRELDDMKLSIHKVQAVFNDTFTPSELEGIEIITHETRGRLHTIICRGSEEYINGKISSISPVFSEIIPLTLDEIFISEMEEIGYDCKTILK